MAFELLTETPSLLREGHYVHFVGTWGSATGKADQWYRVERSFQIRYDVNRIIGSGETQDLSFEAAAGSNPVGNTNLALLPDNPDTLYELLIGIRGIPLIYPRYANSYYFGLEASQTSPDVTDERLRYLGFYDQQDSPIEAPKLREYTIRNQESPVLRAYNDTDLDEALILRMVVNRCRIEQVAQGSIPEDMRQRARAIKHYSHFRY